jgi:integrase/recombinase XerC
MKILSEYFSYLQYEKRYSKQTIIAYKTDIAQFLSFCNIEETDLRKIKTQDIREWLISLAERDLSSKTLNRKITSLKRLFHFLKTKGVVDINPVDTISSLKVNRKLPEYVEEFNMNELLDDEKDSFLMMISKDCVIK